MRMQPKTEQDQAEKRPGAATEPSTALDPKKTQDTARDKNKDPDTLENDEAYQRGQDPDNID
jgi:hypothetical protein